jgi:outer membrane protein
MNQITKRYFAIVALVMVASFSSIAQNLKVAYINTDELLIALPEVKVANDSLISKRDKHEKKITSMFIELRTKASSLESKKNAVAPIQYEKEMELLKAEEQKIMEMDELGKREIQVVSEGFSKPLEEKVNKTIKEVATEAGYAYVINSNNGFILYAQDEANILEKVKAKLLAPKK